MPIVKIDSDLIQNKLICPEGKKRIEYCDVDLPGFILEVRSTSPGQGTYYVRYKDSSSTTRYVKIGRTTEISLNAAIKKAKAVKAEIAQGADPRHDLNVKKAIVTFSEFFKEKYIPYVKSRKKTWEKDEEYFRLRLEKEFGDKRLNQITRHQIQDFHTSLKNDGLASATCNHYLKLLKHCFNLAIDWEMLDKNPVVGIPYYKEQNLVENYLTDEELKKFMTVLMTDENRTVCQICLFLISTGARLNEVLQAKWKDYDKEKRQWLIPASNSKSGKLRSVPLNDTAIDVLNQLDTENGFDYLFINKKTGKPYTTIQKVWNRLRKKAGVPHLRIHDLRHQFASFLVNSGRTLYEVQQILGHSTHKVTERYSHLSTKTLQSAAASASDRLNSAMKKAS